MNWVTWENVGIDRIGCAWLILREIDPKATFVFVPRGATLPTDAEPFDVPDVRFSHHGGHCSFHALVEQHKLTDPILHRIARIIDETDTVQAVSVTSCGRSAPVWDRRFQGRPNSRGGG